MLLRNSGPKRTLIIARGLQRRGLIFKELQYKNHVVKNVT